MRDYGSGSLPLVGFGGVVTEDAVGFLKGGGSCSLGRTKDLNEVRVVAEARIVAGGGHIVAVQKQGLRVFQPAATEIFVRLDAELVAEYP